ncbi:MAG TPA: FG-GAP-like repeat-containing protein, partial [Bryobacteraceae bacterium]
MHLFAYPRRLRRTRNLIFAALLTALAAAARQPQTISFPAIPDQLLGVSPFPIAAHATSHLRVTFSSDTSAVCVVSGAWVLPLTVGNCTVRASQSGSGAYAAANPVTQTFTINAPLPAGTMKSGSQVGTPGTPNGVAVADFNRDGYPDAAITSSGSLVIALGGASGFASTSSITLAAASIYAVAAADLNHDGNPDLVVAAKNTDGATVIIPVIGQGTGVLTPQTAIALANASTPTAVAVGNFNVGGNQDVAVADSNGRVTVLRGDGFGNLTPRSSFSPLLGAIKGIVSADVNHDGFMDLIFACPEANQVVIYKANSDGVFSPAGQYLWGSPAGQNALAVGDFNNDGNVDFAVTLGATNQVAFYTSDVSGSFQRTGALTTVGAGPMSLVAGDFNGDGKQDLAVGGSGGVYFLLGNGAGAFTAAGAQPNYPVFSSGNVFLAAGDFNGDRREDVLTVNDASAAFVVLSGALAHTTTALSTTVTSPILQGIPVPLTATVTPPGQFFGAFTGGSVRFYDNSNLLTTISGDSPYLYTVPPLSPGDHILTANYSAPAGFDGSASKELPITASAKQPQTITFSALSDRPMSPLRIQLTATSDSHLAVSLSSTTTSICTVDGNLLTLRSIGQCSITANQAGDDSTYNAATPVVRTFTISIASQRIRAGSVLHPTVGLPPFEFPAQADSLLPVSLTSLTPSVCRLAASLVTPLAAGACTIEASQAGSANYNPAPAVDKSFEVKLAKPSGVLTPGTSIRLAEGVTGGFAPLATGDFNGDGLPDLAVINVTTSSVSVLLGDVSGAFHPLSATFPVTGSPMAVVAGDFNADGYSDLAVSSAADGSIAVLLGGPGGALTPAPGSPFAPGANALAMAVGDFNGDGIEDLVTGDSPGGSIVIWAGNGQGGFEQVSQTTVGGSLIGLAVGDFDKNGKQDVVGLDFFGSQMFILMGNGNGGFLDSPMALPVGTFPLSISVGDFDGNGNPDVAVVDISDNTVTLFIGDGRGGFQAAPSFPPTGHFPGALVVGDFNGDGLADIGASTNDGLTLLKNTGSLSFQEAGGSPFPLTAASSMVTGDFNNDGRLDVAAIEANLEQIDILLGAAAPTTSTLSITSPVPALLGSTVSLKLTVANTGTSINPLSGTATLISGNVVIATAHETTSPFTFTASGFFPGNHAPTAHFAGANGSADSDSNPVTFDVQAPQTISFGQLSDVALVKSPFQISATATSTLAVTFSSGNTSVCKVAGTTVTLVAAGKCTIMADQPGDVNWAPAPQVAVEFTVKATAQQTITFPVIPDHRYGTPPFAIPAKSDSRLPVSLASKTLDVCSTAGTLVTILTPGTCRIEASQAGNVSYDPASAVAHQFVIQNAAPAGILTALPASPISVGADSKGAAAADLDHDGLIDLIVVDNAADKVTVLLADGNGGYNAAHFDTDHLPAGVTIADFDRDGNPDFAVVNTSNTITVYLGDGHGAFTQVSGSPFATGLTSPNRAVVGDFDGDGIPDLAVSADSGTSFSILSGLGDGTFHAGTLRTVSATPLAIAVGDFNRDGRQDLAIALSDDTVAVLNGNSEGGFTADTNGPFAVGNAPAAILADDFNNDGKTDLATANKTDGTISILIGDGAGNFTKPNDPVAAGTLPTSLAAGDYNGDGFVDLVVAHQSSVGVLLNNGDGSFRTGPNFDVASGVPDTVVAADLDNDGAIDLAVTNQNGGKLTLFRGASNPTHTTLSTISPLTVTTGAQISFDIAVAHNGAAEYELPHGSVTVSDNGHLLESAAQTVAPYTFTTPALTAGSHAFTATYSGDQRSVTSTSDSVTIIALTPQTITFGPLSNKILGSGQITLTATASSSLAVSYSTNSSACSVTDNIVTLSGAGVCSIKASQPGNGVYAPAPDVFQSFTISLPQTISFDTIHDQIFGTSPFTTAARASSGLAITLSSLTSDVCKIARDLITLLSSGTCQIQATQPGGSSYAPATPVTQTFTVRSAVPGGAFISLAPIAAGVSARAAVVGDFNGDHTPDLAVADASVAGNVTVLLGPDFSVTSAHSVGSNPSSIAVGDFDVDGNLDLVTPNQADNSVSVLRGEGVTTLNGFNSPRAVAIGDFDGDGWQNLAVANGGANNVSVVSFNGQEFTPVNTFATGTQPSAIALGDFNGDGKQDLAIANQGSNDVTVLLGSEGGNFTPAPGSPYAVGAAPVHLVVGDFNLDGVSDLAVANSGGTGSISVLKGNGDGSFTAFAGGALGSSKFESVAVSDFNGDGKPDIAAATYAQSGGVSVFLGDGNGGFSALPSTFAVGSFPTGLIATDLNGDGAADLVATNSGDGTVSVLLGAAPQIITFAPISAVQAGAHVDLNATASSGLTVTFASSTTSVCTVSGTSATAVSAGTCTIVASQAGDNTHAPASASLSFEVTAPPPPPQVPQTISFSSLGTVAFGSPAFAITATASSGLPVALSSGTPAVCSVGSNTVSVLTAGTCSITATQNGNSAFLAADSVTQSFVVLSPLTITTSSLPNGTAGAGYSATVAANGGTGGPYSWTAASGSLPQGIGLGSNGLLTGNPGMAGTFTFTAQASDGISTPARASLSITVFGQLSITTTSLPNGTVGSTYGPQSLSAKGGSGSFTWTASGLPGGLTLSSSGLLSGTPNAAGNFSASFTATDTNTGQTLTATIPLSIVPAATILKVSPSSLTAGAGAGAAITGSFTASGGVPPYQFSASGLPGGISLSQGGALSGSSSATGSYSAAVTVTDSATPTATATAQLTVNIFGITSTSLNNGVATVFYSAAFQASGGTPPIVFSATGLPTGLSLSGDGALTGTVASSGTFNFTVQASDSSGLTSSRDFGLTMGKAPVSAKAFSLPDGTVGSPYSGSLTPSGGTAPYSWSLISGVLPAGLSLSSSGVVSGIPTTPGASTIGAQVTDSTGGIASGAVSIAIAPAAIGISAGALPSGVVNFYYGPQIVDVTGGTAPYTFELSGSLPPGLDLDGNVISGTPSTAGTFPFSLKVTDAAGKQANAPSSILIRPPASDLLLLSGSISFSLAQGATVLPAAQSVGVQSTVVADSIVYTASANSGASWLTVTGGGTTPGAVSIALTDAALSLPLGSNFAMVTVTCTSSTCQGKSQTIPVSLTVSSPPAQLSVGDSLLSFNSVSALSSPIQIQNIGGGVLTVSAVSCGAPWCSAGSFTSSLTGGASTQVTISVSAAGLASGVYRTSVSITSSAGSASVPVTFLVTDNAIMALTPSGTRFDMAAGGQPGNVHGSFQVVAAGGAINWSAAKKDDSPWLTLETAAGSSSLDIPGAVNYSINSSAASLVAGAYYATIEVTSPDASNSPQDYQVVLNVATTKAPPHLTPNPGGLTFNNSTTSEVVTVYSTSSAPTPYQASAATADGGKWLSVTPTGGASSSAPGVSTVTIQTTGLAAGVYTGSVSIAAAMSGISVVNVSLIIPATAPVSRAAPASALTPHESCTAANVVPTQIGLVNSFSTPASWPTPLAVQLSDDCGNVIGDGQVIATFSNGDPPLSFTLSNSATGVYSGTWTPRSSTSRITIKARGSKTGLIPATAELSGSVVPNAAPSID